MTNTFTFHMTYATLIPTHQATWCLPGYKDKDGDVFPGSCSACQTKYPGILQKYSLLNRCFIPIPLKTIICKGSLFFYSQDMLCMAIVFGKYFNSIPSRS